MRTLRICRPKRMEAALVKLIVEVDEKNIGKLRNGNELSVSVDEQAHTLFVHGGKLAGKSFSSKLMIPAGSCSYSFQIDMLPVSGASNNYKPVFRPCGGSPLKDTTRVVTLLGATLTIALLDANLRDILAKIPQARLQLILEEQQWRLDLCAGAQRKAVLTQPYSQTKGKTLGLMINAIEHAGLQTPEGREKLTNQIFDQYVCFFPDYCRTGPNEFALKAE